MVCKLRIVDCRDSRIKNDIHSRNVKMDIEASSILSKEEQTVYRSQRKYFSQQGNRLCFTRYVLIGYRCASIYLTLYCERFTFTRNRASLVWQHLIWSSGIVICIILCSNGLSFSLWSAFWLNFSRLNSFFTDWCLYCFCY